MSDKLSIPTADVLQSIEQHERLRALNAELVATLEKCVAGMRDHNKQPGQCDWDFGEGFDGTLDQARAAIAKAKGES